VRIFSSNMTWRRCMEVEPTLDQEFNPGRATVLKTVASWLAERTAATRPGA
jgi:hypothetical protein